jgi:hypothetical protein
MFLIPPPAPDKPVRLTVSIEKLESLTINAIGHRDETDQRIVELLSGRALLDRNSLPPWPGNGGGKRWRAGAVSQVVRPPNPRQTLHRGPVYK